MPDRRGPSIFSVPPHRAFADALVEGLIAQYGGDALALAQGIILVPNNRAGIAIRDAFVRQSESGLLLPRLVPVGDVDLSENVGAALDPIDAEPIPPAIDPLRRQLILARLLQQSGTPDAAQAMRLAADLGRVLDQLKVERIPPSALRDIDTAGLSSYWQASLDRLEIILAEWPRQLERLGAIDLAERRNRQLERVAKCWTEAPPPGFVVAAGISTAAPAVLDLVRVVSRLPKGQVVLAALDLEMPNDQWDALVGNEREQPLETHPQFHLHLILDRIGVARAEVETWRWGKDDPVRKGRGEAVSRAMAPAAFTREWSKLPEKQRQLKGVYALELATPAEEAQAVALALREAIETNEQTAALVTPDRMLAERVSAQLLRWGIKADDSAGTALGQTLPGMLLRAIAEAWAEDFAPVQLLALLKHPLVKSGEGRMAWLDGVRALDLALRGPMPQPGLAGIDKALVAKDKRRTKLLQAAALWWPEAKAMLEGEAVGLSAMIARLRDVAGALSGDQVWAGQEGKAASDLISNLELFAEDGPAEIEARAFALLLVQLLDGIAIRPAEGGHPRIRIWGLLEAKLQSADVMILAGLNETIWPAISAPDPWLAPAVRRQLRLPSLERRIGLSAHDLASAMGAKSVLLTRAKRDARAPTIASRFWLRLETLANGFAPPPVRYDLLARALDQGAGLRALQPQPSPPVDQRPKVISVTEMDGLKADPYAFYAKRILKLAPLDAPGEEPDMRWRGTFLHAVLGDWGQQDKFAAGKLLPRLADAFDGSGLHPVVRAFWEPQFEEACRWFEARILEQRAEGREPIAAEIEGEVDLAGVTLKGRADRIDRLADGSLAIVDYKTGAPPSDAQVKAGFATQLGLIGVMAESAAFFGVEGGGSLFEYWTQQRNKEGGFGTVKSPTHGKGSNKSDPQSFTADMYQHFEEAVEAWLLGNAPFTAKLHPELAWADYDQLMRYDEWRGRNG